MRGLTVDSGVQTTGTGTFDSFKAVRVSGTAGCCCGCSGGTTWQFCSASTGHDANAISFELNKSGQWLFTQNNWYTLPVGCTSAGRAADIYCTPAAPVTVSSSDTWITSWREPRLSEGHGDNCGDLILNLYGISHPTNAWVLLGTNMNIMGASNPAARYPEAVGTFTQFKAVYVSGTVQCNTGLGSSQQWQACSSTYFSFELKQNSNYLFEQPNYYTLNSRCVTPSTPTGDIVCTASSPVTIRNSDTLTTTWYEPSHSTSLSDNGGTLVLNLYGWRTGGL